MKNELNGKRPALRLFALKTSRVYSHGCFLSISIFSLGSLNETKFTIALHCVCSILLKSFPLIFFV